MSNPMKTITFEGRGADTVAVNNSGVWIYKTSDDARFTLKRRDVAMGYVVAKKNGNYWDVKFDKLPECGAKRLQEKVTIIKSEPSAYSDILTIDMPTYWHVEGL